MPKKQPSIRWRQRDLDELQRTINNFNSKLYRMQKKNPDLEGILPSRVTKTNLQNEIATRQEYNKIIQSLQEFSKRGGEGDLPSTDSPIQKTEWEIEHQTLRGELANKRQAQKREELAERNVKTGGKDTGVSRVAMGKIRENQGKDINPDMSKKRSTTEFNKAVKNIDSILNKELIEKKQLVMRENYIKGLTDYGILDDPKVAKELLKYINGVSHDTFVNTVVDDEFASFQWYKDKQELQVRIQGVLEAWKTAYNDEQGG